MIRLFAQQRDSFNLFSAGCLRRRGKCGFLSESLFSRTPFLPVLSRTGNTGDEDNAEFVWDESLPSARILAFQGTFFVEHSVHSNFIRVANL